MKLRAVAMVLGAVSLCGASAYADSFTGPTGPLGPSSVFSIASTTVTAYAFNSPGTPGVLYFKNSGANETGIGVVSNDSDHEITKTTFVTLDIENLLTLGVTALALSFESVQSGDSFSIWGSNTLGTPGTLLAGPDTTGNVEINVPGFSSYRYISVDAPTGDVLLSDLSVPSVATPEPSSIALLFVGLLGLAAVLKFNKSGVLRTN